MRVFFERDLVQRSIEAEVRDVIVNGNRSVGLEGERAKVLLICAPHLSYRLVTPENREVFLGLIPASSLGTPVVGTTDCLAWDERLRPLGLDVVVGELEASEGDEVCCGGRQATQPIERQIEPLKSRQRVE